MFLPAPKIVSRGHRWTGVYFFTALLFSLIPGGDEIRAADAPPVAACHQLLLRETRFTQGLMKSASARLARFQSSTARRYEADPRVVSLVKSFTTESVTEIGDHLPGLRGRVWFAVSADGLEIRLPDIRLVDETLHGAPLETGKVSPGLSSHFVKLMTAVFLAADLRVQSRTDLRTVVLRSHIQNEALANLLVDFGFFSAYFGGNLTPEEIAHIIRAQRVPATRLDFFAEQLQRIRREEKASADKPIFSHLDSPAADIPIYSLPLALEISLP